MVLYRPKAMITAGLALLVAAIVASMAATHSYTVEASGSRLLDGRGGVYVESVLGVDGRIVSGRLKVVNLGNDSVIVAVGPFNSPVTSRLGAGESLEQPVRSGFRVDLLSGQGPVNVTITARVEVAPYGWAAVLGLAFLFAGSLALALGISSYYAEKLLGIAGGRDSDGEGGGG